jgi:hypothetical protein
MTYIEYIEQATADGYPLRYYRVKRRIPALLAMGTAVLVLLTMIKGCNMIHASAPYISYGALEILTAILFTVFFLGVAYFAKTQKIGFVDFTEDELLFLDEELNITERIAIADLRAIWNTKDRDSLLQGITSRGRFLKLTLEYTDGRTVQIEVPNQAFFPELHERAYVTALHLLEHLLR